MMAVGCKRKAASDPSRPKDVSHKDETAHHHKDGNSNRTQTKRRIAPTVASHERSHHKKIAAYKGSHHAKGRIAHTHRTVLLNRHAILLEQYRADHEPQIAQPSW